MPPGSEPRRSRWRRRSLIGAGAITFLVALVAVPVVVLLANLAHPSIKTRLQRVLRGSAGLELEYTVATAGIGSGAHLEGIRVATPAALRGFAPDLVRIGSVDVRWQLGDLLGSAHRLEVVAVHDVEVVIVLDESGKTSFDFTPEDVAAPPPPGPPVPRSRMIADLLATVVPLTTALVDPIRVTVLRTGAGAVIDELTLEGLSLVGEAYGGKTLLKVGARDKPLTLRLTRKGTGTGAATLALWLEATAQAKQAALALGVRLTEQSLDPQLAKLTALGQLLSLAAGVTVDDKAGRVVATLAQAGIADGALALSAEVELPDDAAQPLLLRRADGKLDAARLLALAPAALALRLPRIGGGTVDLHAERVALSTMPRVLEGGSLLATGQLTELRAELPGLAAVLPGLRFELRSGADLHIDADVTVELESLRWTSPGARAGMRGATVGVKARGVELDPSRLAGDVSISGRVASLQAGAGALAVDADGLELGTKAQLVARPPYGASATLRATRLRVRAGGQTLVDDPLRLDARVQGVQPDATRPVASTGGAHLQLAVGAFALALDAKKARDTLDYTLEANAPSLHVVERALGKAGALKVPWSQVGIQLRSKGVLEGLGGAPTLAHDTSLSLARPAVRGGGVAVAASALALSLSSRGGARRHEGDLTLALTGLSRDGAPLGDGRIGAHLRFDAEAASLSAKITSTGSAAPDLGATLSLAFDRGARRLAFDLDLELKRLAALQPLFAAVTALRGFATSNLELGLKGKGALTGLVEAVDKDGGVRLARAPELARGEATLDVRAHKLAWRSQDRSVETPDISWHGELRADADKRTLRAALHLGELHMAFGPTRLDVAGVEDALEVTVTGAAQKEQVELADRMTLKALRQELAPPYPTADLSLSVRVRATRDGVVRVPELRFENRAAGTTIALRGGVDLGEHRRSLSLRGSFTQDLAKAWRAPQDFLGRGSLSTDVQVESGDLRRFRTTTAVRVKDGAVELPRQKIKIDSIDGEIPVVADVEFGPNGPRLLRETEVNSYSELRFADQHPMLTRRSYLSIARIETPWATVAPLAGNLVVDNNVLSLSQLELGVRGGRVTGRAALALQGRDTKAQLNVRASNVRSSRGEPFDGNAAIGLNVRQRSVQGRAEILRIGRRHLLDILDVVDPPRTDAAMNRVRKAMALGYPDQVRVSFNRGFAAAKITFGGLAKLVRIDEIRGIPMGPIIDRVLDPIFDEEEEE